MIFHTLAHVTPDGKWFSTRHDASVSWLLKEMDEHGILKAVAAIVGHNLKMPQKDIKNKLLQEVNQNPLMMKEMR